MRRTWNRGLVLEHFRQAPSALCRDARPLFQCQGVVGRFDFDERPLADWACVQCDIQGRRVWIERQVGGQGSVIGRLGLPPDDLPHLRHPLEIPLAQRYPNAPREKVSGTNDRNLQTASDEEILFPDDALFGHQNCRMAPQGLGDAVIESWGSGRIRKRKPLMNFPALVTDE